MSLPKEWTRAGLEEAGFVGFVPLSALAPSQTPKLPGIYVVLRESNTSPMFLPQSVAGKFKGVDSTALVAALEAAWISESPIVYIGKANWGSKHDGIRRRLSQYRRHGAGKAVGHRGGEYIWQLDDSSQLLVCWKVTTDEEVQALETAMIDDFEARHGRWPFANRKHERRRARD